MTLVAVASRDPERAHQFIEECPADVPLTPRPAACGSYQELLDRDDIDAVRFWACLPGGPADRPRRRRPECALAPQEFIWAEKRCYCPFAGVHSPS